MGDIPRAVGQTVGETPTVESGEQLYKRVWRPRKIEPRPKRRGRRKTVWEWQYEPIEEGMEALEETEPTPPQTPPLQVPKVTDQPPDVVPPVIQVPPPPPTPSDLIKEAQRPQTPTEPSVEMPTTKLGAEIAALKGEITDADKDRIFQQVEEEKRKIPPEAIQSPSLSERIGGLFRRKKEPEEGKVSRLEAEIARLRGGTQPRPTTPQEMIEQAGGFQNLPLSVQRTLLQAAGVKGREQILARSRLQKMLEGGDDPTTTGTGTGARQVVIKYEPTVNITAGAITSDEAKKDIEKQVEKMFATFETRFKGVFT